MEIFDIFKKKNEKDNSAAEVENSFTENSSAVQSESGINEVQILNKIFQEVYDETSVPTVKMNLTDTNPAVFESKVGGTGYIPHDGNFPTDSKGNQLRFLAQIECEKVNIPEYPKSGLLQFWIMNDDLYGADFDNNTRQDSFRIIYYKDIDKSVAEEEIASKFVENEFDKTESLMPVTGTFGISFTECMTGISDCDYRAEDMICKKYNEVAPEKHLESIYDIECDFNEAECYKKTIGDSFGNKIGGYPAFTQYDPRDEGDTHDFLLLQLDSAYIDDKIEMMWGDSGVCNFFINKEKLKNLDFSDVIYNWDCY